MSRGLRKHHLFVHAGDTFCRSAGHTLAYRREVSFWASYEALNDWHMNTYHKHAKEWAVRSGAIMEDVITNFEFKRARLIRVFPTCAHIQDKPFDLHIEQAVLAEPCPKCGYHFPTMPETRESTAVFKDVPELAIEPSA